MIYEIRFLAALSATVAIETAVLFFVMRKIFGFGNEKIKNKKIIISGLACSTLTIPYLWFVFPAFMDQTMVLVFGEGFAVLAEAGLLKVLLPLQGRQALGASFLANLCSFLAGFVLWQFI